jgi:hypothetical protein
MVLRVAWRGASILHGNDHGSKQEMKIVTTDIRLLTGTRGSTLTTWIEWGLCRAAAVGLLVFSMVACRPAEGAPGKEPLAGDQVPSEMDFQKRLEKLMENWPEEDFSTKLPLDEQVHDEIRRICEEIRRSTEEQIRLGAWPSAEIVLRSIAYVLRDSKRYVKASYSSRSDTKAFNLEVVWEDPRFEIADGRLRFRHPSGRRISPFADVMIPILRQQAQSIPESATHAIPISWPVLDESHQKLTRGVNRLLELYLKELKDFLEDADESTGRIKEIEYAFWFDEAKAYIRVSFDISNAGGRSHDVGVKLDYKDGKFRLKELIGANASGGAENQHVRFAGNSTMDSAVEKWLAKPASQDVFEDARVGPPFKWVEAAKELPEGLGRIVQMTQRSHPFLGEHHRKFRIECSDGKARTFRLLQDTGDLTSTEVYLIRAAARQYIRLRDGHITGGFLLKPNGESYKLPATEVVIALDTLAMCSPAGLAEGEPLFSFHE